MKLTIQSVPPLLGKWQVLVCLFATLSSEAGVIYVADYGSGNVYSYNEGDSSSQAIFASLSGPYSLAADSLGNIFVGDYNASAIYKITPGGGQTTFATGLMPYGMAFDTNGHLFVTTGSDGVIYRFTPDGTQFTFDAPTGYLDRVAFDPSGNMFVSAYSPDETYALIYKYDSLGNRSVFTTNVNNPGALAVGVDSNLYMADGINTVHMYLPDGTHSTYASGFSTPTGLDFDSEGNLLVSEYFNRISMIPPGGGSFSVFDNTGLDRPSDVLFVVPEPGGIAVLLFAGMACLLFRRRR